MKDNQKYAIIGMVILAAVLVFAAYKFFYSEDVKKAEQVQTEINTLQTRVMELNEKNANRLMYESGIVNSKDIIDKVLSLYGPGNTTEKTIMMIVDMCKKTGIGVKDITFKDNSLIYASEIAEEGAIPELQIFQSGVAINISSGYTQLKKITDYINSYPERMNVENFDVQFDPETGRLNSMLNINLYSVADENHQYVEPVIEDIELGSTNIFRTSETVTEDEENIDGLENGESIENSEPDSEE